MKKYIVSSMLLLIFAGCSYPQSLVGLDAGDSSNSSSPSDQNSQTLDPGIESASLKILSNKCSSCHAQSSGPAGVYGLQSVQHMVAAGLILPGNANASPLFVEILNNSMPPGQPLAAADKETLRAWINRGSSNVEPTPPTPPPPAPGPVPPVVSGPEPTFSYLKSNVIGPKCASCHYTGHTRGGYAFDTYKNVLKAVSKSKPESSVLYTISRSGQMPPRSNPQLSSEELNLILDWIKKGALNN
ncbi:hypothetical protein [Bdellovibrio sp. BCCA]|uniref:hypothetical protein n=1 Tax=Bdellovibrio sp. BCCA TaxID=3136281 RepID=UPI0030EFDBA9